MEPDGLRGAEVVRVAEDRRSGRSVVERSKSVDPIRARVIAVLPGAAFAGQESGLVEVSPMSGSSEAHPAVMVLVHEQRGFAGALLP